MIELILKGELITPLITKGSPRLQFYFKGCQVTILQPRRRYYNKINASKPMFPYSYLGYLGTLELKYKAKQKNEVKKKLKKMLQIKAIGLYLSEGMGRIQWQDGEFRKTNKKQHFTKWKRKIKIRKGLPHNLSDKAQRLIQMALLHDFFQTIKHRSKIYIEPEIADEELVALLRRHHSETNDELLLLVKKYDRIAASITRPGYKSPRPDRYNWKAKKKVDFSLMAQKLTEISNQGVWKLYKFIYENKDLEQLNESLEYGHTSLKRHLLIMVNVIVQDLIQDKIRFSAHQKAI